MNLFTTPLASVITLSRLAGIIVGLSIVLMGGCASDPQILNASDVEVLEATVTAVDAPGRVVSLRGPTGDELVVYVGPEVRNLAQVRVGDTLKVSFTRTLMASMVTAAQASSDVSVEIEVARAAEGARPQAAVSGSISEMVEIISVGREGRTVTFRDPTGELQSIDVLREDTRAFVHGLDVGDQVDLTYAEAVAVEIVHVD